MRKRIVTQDFHTKASSSNQDWLNLEELVEIDLTSEDPAHPIESALLPGQNSGWVASQPGEQSIRLNFTAPQKLQRIWLHFIETSNERTQEYTLSCSYDKGQTFQEIVRQQWNFSPTGSNSEIEDHPVDLHAVTALELSINPDINGGDICATLAQLRLA